MAKNSGKWALGALAAGVAGYVAGLLTAPKSGKETRQDIQKAASHAKTEAERKLKKLHSDLGVLIEKASLQAKSLEASAKVELTKVLETAKVAKEKARTILSALHEGDADDKDLQKAIDEVTIAMKHLEKFVTKHGATS